MEGMPKNNNLIDELWKQYGKSRSIVDRNRLFLHYQHVLDQWAESFERRLVKNFRADLDDLKNAGAVAMIRAIESFNQSRGTTFEQYAWRRVQGGMMDYLRSWGKRGQPAIVVTSLDKPYDGGGCLCDFLAGRANLANEVLMELESINKRLPSRHRTIMELRAKGHTLDEIGRKMGYTQSRISQLYKEGILILREFRRLKER